MVSKGVGGRVELGLAEANYIYREWINNKALMYSPGNYIRYPTINYNGREYVKEHTHTYV